ncbi:MAG: hypothetical protein F6K21_21440 [Symploca sp. SIO2D2]|nr:hypothetical protein [Symploca sp. SIO2D2]
MAHEGFESIVIFTERLCVISKKIVRVEEFRSSSRTSVQKEVKV